MGRASVLIDQFLDDAYEVDVDALCDGNDVTIGGIMQHIEQAGVHSGDSACVVPPYKISYFHLDIIRDHTRRIGLALGVKGLFNIQFAVKDDEVYVLEVNPRASRTVPFISKATGHPLARYAAQIAAGATLADLGFLQEPSVSGFFIKEAVFPFQKFPGVDTRLGPEMRSTGEVMGQASSFGHAFIKSQASAGLSLPASGTSSSASMIRQAGGCQDRPRLPSSILISPLPMAPSAGSTRWASKRAASTKYRKAARI